MKYDPFVYRVKHYLRQGTENILKEDVEFSIKRHVREHYIGMSDLTMCGRLMWAKYYRPELVPNTYQDYSKSMRIFDLGHVIEDMTLKILKAGGADISDAQLAFSDFDGIVKGHADSKLDNDCILEVKSMNQHSFEALTLQGVEQSHLTYYVQMQMYMHYSNLNDAVIVATNKNTSEIECQHVELNPDVVDFYLQKLNKVVNGKFHLIDKPFIPDTAEECIFCPFLKICHKG